MNPLFSIITVTRNAAEALDVTLQSVREQTFRLFEVIVQDGASTDNTVEVARNAGIYNLSVVSEPDTGVYDAMNRAMRRATGDYLIFLNAGDSLHAPDTLDILAKAIIDNDYPGIAYGRTVIVDDSRIPLGPRHLEPPEVLTPKSFREGMLVCHQAFVVLRKLAPKYDLRYRLSSDFDWCIRCIIAARRRVYVDAVLIDYLSTGLSSRHRVRSLLERFRIMCRYYGTLPTVGRHLGFVIGRLTGRRKKAL